MGFAAFQKILLYLGPHFALLSLESSPLHRLESDSWEGDEVDPLSHQSLTHTHGMTHHDYWSFEFNRFIHERHDWLIRFIPTGEGSVAWLRLLRTTP